MFGRLRTRLTYANVVATLALFVAMGGTATAATVLITSNAEVAKGTISGHTPPRGKHPNVIAGSVNGGDIANGSLSAADLAAKQIGARDLQDGSVFEHTLAPKQIGARDLQDGSVAEQTLAPGQIGGRDLKPRYVVGTGQSFDPGVDGDVTSTCDAGDIALSGSGHWDFTSGSVNGIRTGFNSARVTGRNNGQHAQTLTAEVMCLPR